MVAAGGMTPDVFHAVSDPNRRRLLDLLAEGERAVMDLVRLFTISQPAISQHLKVLREAGLVTVRKLGRRRMYALNPDELRPVADWIAHYEKFWDDRLDRLGQYLKDNS